MTVFPIVRIIRTFSYLGKDRMFLCVLLEIISDQFKLIIPFTIKAENASASLSLSRYQV
jgi:hypothetical protein